MKKEYISPELLVVAFDTASTMMVAVTSSTTATPGESLAPGQYNDEEDEEDWEDDGKASRNGRRGY
jgi:hypothetical protein